jgi:hypothetical protein
VESEKPRQKAARKASALAVVFDYSMTQRPSKTFPKDRQLGSLGRICAFGILGEASGGLPKWVAARNLSGGIRLPIDKSAPMP